MGSIPLSFDSISLSDINFLYLFLFFLLIVSLFELWIDYRQHGKYLIKEKPKELTYVNDEEFNKAQAYGLDKSNFGFISSFLSTTRLVIFLLSGVYPLLWSFSDSIGQSLFSSFSFYSTDTPFYTSLLFFYFDHIIDLLFDLPVSLYSTFIIEEKHGFNKQTISLYISDIIKSLFLIMILGLPLLGLSIKVIEWGGPYFYLYLSGFMLIIQLLMTIIYPMFIQPCFNKVEPLSEGELRTAIEELSLQCKFPLTQLYSIDGSKRSGHSNAYFFGFFKNKRIVIYDTLINQCSIKEVVGILGHEIGHWALNHTVKLMIYGIIQTTIIFFLFGKVIHFDQLYEDFGFHNIRATYIGLKLFLFILLPLQHLLSFISNALSRRFEFQADYYSCELNKGEDLLNGLTKLQKENKGTMIADSLYAACHYSHPPVLQRLEKIQQYLEKKKQKSK